jgi:signal transduction histidine kinase
MNTPFEDAVAKRLGALPNFFRLSSSEPKITENLWGFAQFAYLDNPLPSLFKERLFVYLSRFCDIRYCIARHVGFLIGLGYPAGDASCLPQKVESVVPLLRRRLPRGEDLLPTIAVCAACDGLLSPFPAPDSEIEQALFACATHVFLQTADAPLAHEALRRALGPSTLEQLNLFLAFVRTAHYWTKLHPELGLEEDVIQLLNTHEILAHCILKDPEALTDSLSQQVGLELAFLRKLRGQHESTEQALQKLSFDHQYVKQSLYETEENLRELISAMPVAVYACDRDGWITYCNRRMAEIWDCTPDPEERPCVPNSCQIYRGDDIRLRPEDATVRRVLATGEPVVNCELVVERSDASRISVLANITALRNPQGAVTGAVCIFQDITEFNQIQKEREGLLYELERSNRELSEFSYAVSHDLKAPIRHVRMLTQLLASHVDSSQEDSSRLLNLIERTAAGMDLLVESLLRYAQAGNGQLICKQVPVETIIESVRATLTPVIVKTSATIAWKTLPTIEADPILLEHLFQNLIANAIQYHRPEEVPMVEISGSLCGKEWQFSVEDNGQGIPSKYQNRVFEPLKRLHGSDNPGTGLGLALCRTIVARHGGRIWVESEGAGKGTIFRFTLPVSQTLQSVAASIS